MIVIVISKLKPLVPSHPWNSRDFSRMVSLYSDYYLYMKAIMLTRSGRKRTIFLHPFAYFQMGAGGECSILHPVYIECTKGLGDLNCVFQCTVQVQFQILSWQSRAEVLVTCPLVVSAVQRQAQADTFLGNWDQALAVLLWGLKTPDQPLPLLIRESAVVGESPLTFADTGEGQTGEYRDPNAGGNILGRFWLQVWQDPGPEDRQNYQAWDLLRVSIYRETTAGGGRSSYKVEIQPSSHQMSKSTLQGLYVLCQNHHTSAVKFIPFKTHYNR